MQRVGFSRHFRCAVTVVDHQIWCGTRSGVACRLVVPDVLFAMMQFAMLPLYEPCSVLQFILIFEYEIRGEFCIIEMGVVASCQYLECAVRRLSQLQSLLHLGVVLCTPILHMQVPRIALEAECCYLP